MVAAMRWNKTATGLLAEEGKGHTDPRSCMHCKDDHAGACRRPPPSLSPHHPHQFYTKSTQLMGNTLDYAPQARGGGRAAGRQGCWKAAGCWKRGTGRADAAPSISSAAAAAAACFALHGRVCLRRVWTFGDGGNILRLCCRKLEAYRSSSRMGPPKKREGCGGCFLYSVYTAWT